MSCGSHRDRRHGPLCEHELHFLRLGHVLIRHSRRYPLIIMWLVP